MIDRRTFLVRALQVASGVAVWACAPAAPSSPAAQSASAAAAPKRGGTFVFALREEAGHINPARATGNAIIGIGAQVYNTLLRNAPDMGILPSLAEKWEIAPDGKVYTFHLARDVKWHDGKPFTSGDVKFTVEQVILPFHSQGKAQFGEVAQIDTPDELTVIFRLKNPSPTLLLSLTFNAAPILPKHLWEGTDILANPLNNRPVGTGPFVFKEWIRGDHVTLDRNPDYWIKDRPYVDRVVLRTITDPNARLQALEAGEVDAVFGFIPFTEYQRLAMDPRYKSTITGSEYQASNSTNLAFNLRREPYSKVDVRRAIAHALDQGLINDKATSGVSRVAKSHIPQGLAWSNPNVRQYEFDPKKAEAMLDAAGYPRVNGIRFRTDLHWNSVDAEHTASAQVIGQLLKAVGIEVRLLPNESAVWEDNVYIKSNFDLSLHGVGTGPDPSISAYWRNYHSSNIKPVRLLNNTAYANKRVDELFNLAAIEPDQAKRIAYFKEQQELMKEDLPSIPMIERSDPKVWRAIWDGEVVAGPAMGLANSWDNVWKK